jgi:hypothetical protein
MAYDASDYEAITLERRGAVAPNDVTESRLAFTEKREGVYTGT